MFFTTVRDEIRVPEYPNMFFTATWEGTYSLDHDGEVEFYIDKGGVEMFDEDGQPWFIEPEKAEKIWANLPFGVENIKIDWDGLDHEHKYGD